MRAGTLLLLISLFSFSESISQTQVSGNVFSNTTWTLANSPYIVTDTIAFFANVTLTIEAGVVVKFNDKAVLHLRGANLVALGSVNDSILFTSNSSAPVKGSWNGILLNAGSTLNARYCKFKYAQAAISINWASSVKIEINCCLFEQNISGTGGGGGNDIFGSLDSCYFLFNDIGARGLTYGRHTFTNSAFRGNKTGVGGTNGTVIINCTFCDHSDFAVNMAKAVINCNIQHNNIGVREAADSLINCIISNNKTGIEIGSSLIRWTGNSICHNRLYNMVNLGSHYFPVYGNCWCETDSAAIAAKIYDGYDEVSRGLLTFLPLSDGTPEPLADTTNCCSLPFAAGPVVGAKNVCYNSSSVYSISPVANASGYTWTVPSGAVLDSGQNSGTVRITFRAMVKLKVSPFGVCGYGPASSHNVTISPLPVVGATGVPEDGICAGDSVTLKGTGAKFYVWSHGITDGVTFAPNASGKYTLVGTNALGCSDTFSVTVNVVPRPVFTVQPVDEIRFRYSTAIFTANSPTTVDLQWQENKGSGFVNLTEGGHYTGVNTGTLTINQLTLNHNGYKYRCIAGAGCSDTSDAALLTVNDNVGISEQINPALFNIYPNPSNQILTAVIDPLIAGSDYVITDITGRHIMTGRLSNPSTDIDVSGMQAGAYIIKVVGEGITVKKFIKQ